MNDTEKQEQIETLVKEIEDEVENNGTFNGIKHLILWKLDREKAFEVFEKGILNNHATFVMK